MKEIHIGSIIKKKFEESELTIKDFAAMIYCDRTTVYDIFKRKSIDVERLVRISLVLNYDFINEIYLKPIEICPSSATPTQTILIAVPVDAQNLDLLNLPEAFIRLIKEE